MFGHATYADEKEVRLIDLISKYTFELCISIELKPLVLSLNYNSPEKLGREKSLKKITAPVNQTVHIPSTP